MNQFLALALASVMLVTPTLAQGLSPEAMAKQNQAIAVRVQQQLMACWNVPPGETAQRLALDIVFFGDGRLNSAAAFSADDAKLASKHPMLASSILAAVEKCVPFEGLVALGAEMDEEFSVTIYFQS